MLSSTKLLSTALRILPYLAFCAAAGLPAHGLAAETVAVTAAVKVPARVHAIYHITWNGLDLGDFTWDSAIASGQYKAATSANISALFGAYTWDGTTRSNGAFVTGAPRPAAYKFKFKATDKSGRLDMTFANDKVVKMVEDPPDMGSSGRIPLKPAHMENVLDPLSAILTLTSPGNTTIDKVNPCDRRVSVFDGRQRFDLILTGKGKTQLDGSSAGAKWAFVCRIQYVPIAGHKNGVETKYMAGTDGIEIWLAPVGFANAFIPVNLVIPTWAGSAQITSTKVQIEMPKSGKIASATKP